jgi:hypothetical protein
MNKPYHKNGKSLKALSKINKKNCHNKTSLLSNSDFLDAFLFALRNHLHNETLSKLKGQINRKLFDNVSQNEHILSTKINGPNIFDSILTKQTVC